MMRMKTAGIVFRISAAALLVLLGYFIGGCQGPGYPAYHSLEVLVPENYLVGEAWELGILTPKKSISWFEKEVVLKEGVYNIPELCKEIERTTGKVVTWVPSLQKGTIARDDISNLRHFHVLENVPSENQHGQIEIPKRIKLKHLIDEILAFATEVGLGDRSEYDKARDDGRLSEDSPFIWVAAVSERRIIFLLLPGWGESPGFGAQGQP